LSFPRNELFIGREDQLQSLEKLLLPNTHEHMIIYELGDCEKSTLALEFAYRTLAQHTKHLVFWISAISRENFKLAYQKIEIQLRIPEITDDNVDIK
jgi:hypothetical protein